MAAYLLASNEGARVAVVVGQRVAQLSLLVTADIDGAVVQVDTGVDSFERGVDGVALLIAPNDVVAHLQGDDLLVVEHVFDDDNRATAFLVGLLIGIVFFLGGFQL